MRITKRDSQKYKVYAAEQIVWKIFNNADCTNGRVIDFLGTQIRLPLEKKFASLSAVQKYINKVLQLKSIVEKYNFNKAIKVRKRQGNKACHFAMVNDSLTIAIPIGKNESDWALRELVVLHELAHAINNIEAVSHGVEFVNIYIDLVNLVMGVETKFILQTVMLQNEVNFS